MSTYYMLECYSRLDVLEYQNVDGPPPSIEGVTSWMTGQRFNAQVREPIDFLWDPDTRGSRKLIYDAGIPLYHRDVYATLKEAGVDNLDIYHARITDPSSGEVCADYLAINVIGLIVAADLKRSIYTSERKFALIDTDFDSLAIDETNTRGLLMFRLAECVTGVVIHRKVKEHLERSDLDLTFLEPEDWIG